MEFLTRLATRRDADAIADVNIQCGVEAYSSILPADVIETAHSRHHANYRQQLDWPNPTDDRVLVVAVLHVTSAIVGICTVGKNRAKNATMADLFKYELHSIYVVADCHGRGVATALLRHAMAAFGIARTDSMCVKVLEKNARARRYYEKLGATQVDLQDNAHPVDDDDELITMGWATVANILP